MWTDCRKTGGWLSEDLECGIDTDPMCDHHRLVNDHPLVTFRARGEPEPSIEEYLDMLCGDRNHRLTVRHLFLCLLVCVPVCATVCIILDKLIGG